MKLHLLLATLAAACCVALLALLPGQALGQTETEDTAAITQIVTEIVAQQATIAENQDKMDKKIAEIEEELRLARIYSSRGGKGGGTTP